MSRVLFINRSYWPDSEATGQLLTELCQGLVDSDDDFNVHVIAGKPNHHGESSAIRFGTSHHHGVTIHRVRHTHFNKTSLPGRLINLLTFTFSACLTALRQPSPDILVTETDPFFLTLIGPWLKWWYGCRYIAYLQDIYPDIAVAVGKVREGWLTSLLRRWLVHSCQHADAIIVLSEDMRKRCLRNGIDDHRVRIIHNWANCSSIYPVKSDNAFRQQHQLDGKFVVMYSGNLGLAHVLDPLLASAKALQADSRFVFMLIGEGIHKQRLQQAAADNQLTNVRFLSYQPKETLAHSLSAADVHVVSMLTEAQGCVMPSKLYGILAAGTSVISLCPADSDVSKIVQGNCLGDVCDPFPADTLEQRLTATLLKMANNLEDTRRQGERARELCLQEFDRPIQISRFAALLNYVMNYTTGDVDVHSATRTREELSACES